MASTTVRSNVLPGWARRLRNWLTVDQYEGIAGKVDAPERTIRYRLHESIEWIGESLLTAIFRRRVSAETELSDAVDMLTAAARYAEDHSPAEIC